jgi:hypothetical protein
MKYASQENLLHVKRTLMILVEQDDDDEDRRNESRGLPLAQALAAL